MPKSPAPKRPKVAHSAPPAAPQLAQEALVGYGPALPPAPAVADLQRVMRVQGGLATRALERLEGSTALADDDMARVLGISLRTLQRKRAQPRLDPQLSDRVLQLDDLYAYGAEVFGSLERFRLWVGEPTAALGHRRPLDVIDTHSGVELVEALLGRIEHGVLA